MQWLEESNNTTGISSNLFLKLNIFKKENKNLQFVANINYEKLFRYDEIGRIYLDDQNRSAFSQHYYFSEPSSYELEEFEIKTGEKYQTTFAVSYFNNNHFMIGIQKLTIATEEMFIKNTKEEHKDLKFIETDFESNSLFINYGYTFSKSSNPVTLDLGFSYVFGDSEGQNPGGPSMDKFWYPFLKS